MTTIKTIAPAAAAALVTVRCPRCWGTGKMPYKVAMGVCFRCFGSGTVEMAEAEALATGVIGKADPDAFRVETEVAVITRAGARYTVASKKTGAVVFVFLSPDEAWVSDAVPAAKREAAGEWAIAAVKAALT